MNASTESQAKTVKTSSDYAFCLPLNAVLKRCWGPCHDWQLVSKDELELLDPDELIPIMKYVPQLVFDYVGGMYWDEFQSFIKRVNDRGLETTATTSLEDLLWIRCADFKSILA